MIKILFFIPNLSVGGAEKVLVNLVNNMDKSKYSITVMTLFGNGVNEQFLNSDIRLITCYKKPFKGNHFIFKLFSPQHLFKKFIKDDYDIIVSYLEGTAARIVSGCNNDKTKLVCWIHVEQHTENTASICFRNFEESKKCYEKFDKIICVSEYVKKDFISIYHNIKNVDVLYNTNETSQIIEKSKEQVKDELFDNEEIKICAVGSLKKVKGFDRLIRIQKKLADEGLKTKFYVLGTGSEKRNLEELARANSLEDLFLLLGYHANPYKYIKRCNLFTCASTAEGFSTAATESLILGVPVVTVDVSGMKEMLGENNEYGIVTENNEDALYEGIKKMLTTPGMLEDYAERAKERGKEFSTEKTVMAVEEMFTRL